MRRTPVRSGREVVFDLVPMSELASTLASLRSAGRTILGWTRTRSTECVLVSSTHSCEALGNCVHRRYLGSEVGRHLSPDVETGG